MKALLACASGMSTGMLLKVIREAAAELGVELEINACAVNDAANLASGYDVLLLGPQIGYHAEKIRGVCPVPVAVIDKMDYGMQDGRKILQAAIRLLEAVR